MDTLTRVIKETFPCQARQQEKAFPATEEAMKVQRGALIWRMWREPGEIHGPESSPSSQVRGGDTFTVSRFETKLGKTQRRGTRFFPLRGAKMTHRRSCRSSHNSPQLGSSLSMHYGIPVLSAVVCVGCVRVDCAGFYCYHSGRVKFSLITFGFDPASAYIVLPFVL